MKQKIGNKNAWRTYTSVCPLTTGFSIVIVKNILKKVCFVLGQSVFNATVGTELRQYETDNEHKLLDYLKSICHDTDFPKEKFVNSIRKD